MKFKESRFGMNAGGWVAILCLVIMSVGFAGCSSSDEDVKNRIRVCNYDDEEYSVKLQSNEDGDVLREFNLDEWYDTGDRCGNFDNVPEGRYFISIYENGVVFRDQSDDFYLDAEEDEYFWIESPGELYRD